jgi:hypothetical protein
MTYRRFAAAEEEIDDDWSAKAEAVDEWTLGAPIGRGEAGSVHATSNKGRLGACKLAFQGDMPRGAHERIAADIARALGLPVPPVCLWVNPVTAIAYSISAWAFAQALTWGEMKNQLSAVFMQNVAATFSAARVFHTWIGDTDHNNNDGNVVVDVTATEQAPGFAFIDHAFSMSYTNGFDSAPLAVVPPSYIPAPQLDALATAGMVRAINDLAPDFIDNTVTRIPTAFLPQARGQAIIRGLMKRRTELGPAFGVPLA